MCHLALKPLCCPSVRVQTSPVPARPLLSAAAFFCTTGGHYCVIVRNDSMKDFTGLRFVCRPSYIKLQPPPDTERGGLLWLSAAVIRSCRTSLRLKDFSLSSGFCQYVCLIERWSERQCQGQCKRFRTSLDVYLVVKTSLFIRLDKIILAERMCLISELGM